MKPSHQTQLSPPSCDTDFLVCWDAQSKTLASSGCFLGSWRLCAAAIDRSCVHDALGASAPVFRRWCLNDDSQQLYRVSGRRTGILAHLHGLLVVGCNCAFRDMHECHSRLKSWPCARKRATILACSSAGIVGLASVGQWMSEGCSREGASG